jgi:hypothetical protein
MEQRPAAHAAHAAHVVNHATAELKHELAVAHARIAELEAAAAAQAPRASAAVAANWRLALVAKANASQPGNASAATADAAANQWTSIGWLNSMAPEVSGVVHR